MSTLLITGSTGFLGSEILRKILSKEFFTEKEYPTIRLLVRNPDKLPPIDNNGFTIEIIQGDLSSLEKVKDRLKGITAIIHTASLFNITSSKKDFKLINIKGTKDLIELLPAGSTFILTSSSAVYGFPDLYEPVTEEFANQSEKYLVGNYQKSKREQEHVAKEFCKEKNVKFVAIRPPAILGPNDYYTLPAFYENIKKKRIFLLKGGKSYIPITHVSDVAKAHLLALQNIDSVDGELFHVIGFHSTMKEYLDAMCEGFQLPPVTRKMPYKIAYGYSFLVEKMPITSETNRFSVKLIGTSLKLDNSKIEEKLGFKADYDFNQTMTESTSWFMKHRPEKR